MRCGVSGGIGLLALFIGTHFAGKDFKAKLRQERRYPVSEVHDTPRPPKAGRFADARFYVEGHKYLVSADDAFAGQPLVRHRFLVEFHPPGPEYCSVLHLNASVPDNVQALKQGWSIPPFSVPEKVYKYGDE